MLSRMAHSVRTLRSCVLFLALSILTLSTQALALACLEIAQAAFRELLAGRPTGQSLRSDAPGELADFQAASLNGGPRMNLFESPALVHAFTQLKALAEAKLRAQPQSPSWQAFVTQLTIAERARQMASEDFFHFAFSMAFHIEGYTGIVGGMVSRYQKALEVLRAGGTLLPVVSDRILSQEDLLRYYSANIFPVQILSHNNAKADGEPVGSGTFAQHDAGHAHLMFFHQGLTAALNESKSLPPLFRHEGPRTPAKMREMSDHFRQNARRMDTLLNRLNLHSNAETRRVAVGILFEVYHEGLDFVQGDPREGLLALGPNLGRTAFQQQVVGRFPGEPRQRVLEAIQLLETEVARLE